MIQVNDSGEFQEMEQNYNGTIPHVRSQPAVVPIFRSMLSRDKRLPFDTWNLTETQCLTIPRALLDSSQIPCQGILHSTTPSATGAVPVQVKYRVTCRER